MKTTDPRRERLIHAVHDWRERLVSDNVTAQDYEQFERWLDADIAHVNAWKRSQALLESYDQIHMTDLAPELRIEVAGARSGDTQRTETVAMDVKRFGIAACFLVALTASIYFGLVRSSGTPLPSERYATNLGELIELTLKDGSTVKLAAKSNLEVHWFSERREAVLTAGAAVFDVTHDPKRPFVVRSEQLTARVLGTRFEVRHGNMLQRVLVAEGKVEVSHPGVSSGQAANRLERETLAAGEAVTASLAEGLGNPADISVARVGSWENGKLTYDGAPLAELIADANRYFQRPIRIHRASSHLEEKLVTASLNLSDQRALLDTIAMVLHADVDDSNPEEIVLSER